MLVGGLDGTLERASMSVTAAVPITGMRVIMLSHSVLVLCAHVGNRLHHSRLPEQAHQSWQFGQQHDLIFGLAGSLDSSMISFFGLQCKVVSRCRLKWFRLLLEMQKCQRALLLFWGETKRG